MRGGFDDLEEKRPVADLLGRARDAKGMRIFSGLGEQVVLLLRLLHHRVALCATGRGTSWACCRRDRSDAAQLSARHCNSRLHRQGGERLCWRGDEPLVLRMIFSDLPSPANHPATRIGPCKGFAQAGNRYPSCGRCRGHAFGMMRGNNRSRRLDFCRPSPDIPGGIHGYPHDGMNDDGPDRCAPSRQARPRAHAGGRAAARPCGGVLQGGGRPEGPAAAHAGRKWRTCAAGPTRRWPEDTASRIPRATSWRWPTTWSAPSRRSTTRSALRPTRALKALLDGVELTEARGRGRIRAACARLEPAGQKFDPNLHQAMLEVPDPSVPSCTVGAEMRPGYADPARARWNRAGRMGGRAERHPGEAPANDKVPARPRGLTFRMPALTQLDAVGGWRSRWCGGPPRRAPRDREHLQMAAFPPQS